MTEPVTTRAAARRFVMGPLAQIAPAWVHPVSGLTAAALFEAADVGMDAAPIDLQWSVGG